MTETKFTPGPWFVSEGVTHITVRGDNGEVVFHDDKRIDRVREDARLIAAAPRMYAAMDAMANGEGLPPGGTIERILADARGES